MKRLLTAALVIAALAGTTSCHLNFGGTSKSSSYTSTISGKQGDVLVVINNDYWNSQLGQIIRDSLTAEYPMLPQSEPFFRVSNVPHGGFTSMFQMQRNILRVDISPDNVNQVSYRKNVWANPQCVVELKADSYSQAEELFRKNAANIRSMIEGSERERIISNNAAYSSPAVEYEVQKIFGGSPVFPKDTKIFKQTEDFIWLATTNTDYIKKYIILYKYPVQKGVQMMSRESLIENNLKAVNTNIPGTREGSFMTHSKYIDPTVQYLKYKDKSLAEIRGLWEVENDYMGGPFITHVLYSPDGKYMIGIEGFVYAPKHDKIEHIRDVEAIVYSFKWTGSEN